MVGMQEEQDARLLQLLRDDVVPLPDLLHWLHAHHGPGPPSPEKAALNPPQTKGLLSNYPTDPDEHWREQFAVTNPQSFAVTFLNYVRAEVQPLITAADTTGDMVLKSSMPSLKSEQTSFPEKKSELIVASESSKIAVEPFSDQSGITGTSGNESAAVLLDVKQRERRKAGGTIQPIRSSKPLEMPIYEDDFPALGKAPTSNQRKSSQSRQKRRVTPTPTINPVVASAFILADVEASVTAPQSHSNKAKLSGTGLLKVDMDILMQRCEKNRKQKQKEKPEVLRRESFKDTKKPEFRSASTSSSIILTVHPNPANSHYEVDACDDGSNKLVAPCSTAVVPTSTMTDSVLAEPAHLTPADKEQMSGGPGTSTLGNPSPHLLSKTLTSMAAVHATLMVVKLVPSLLEELHFLLQLLSLEPALPGVGGASRALDSIAELKQEKVPLFGSGDDCGGYACSVLEQAGRILECVGEQILIALIEEPAIARHSSPLLVRLKATLADQQAAALRSFKAYEAASRTNSALEHTYTAGAVRLKSSTMPGLPVSLPFQAARDSRNIFKTHEEQRAYNNREQCRDQFYAVIREAASAYSAFGWISSGSEGEVFLKMKEAVRHFLQVLLVENYPWFAELFLEQVLQVSNCGETDPEVTNLARQDPAKLQRLHDRLTSTTTMRLTGSSQKQGGSSLGNGENRLTLSPSSPWSQVKSMEKRLPSKKAGVSNDYSAGSVQVLNKGRSTGGNSKDKSPFQNDAGSKFSSYFPQALCVYVWFLEAADSHRLNTQMIWSIKGKITLLTQMPPHSRDAADIGSGFTQRVLALRALAGLLGYLFVSPGAGARPPAPGPGGHDCPRRTTWDVSRSEPPVDVPAILGKALVEGSILLNLPWVLEFLRLLKADWQALSHPHFQAIVLALRDVYLLPMLDPSSEQFGVGSICILASLDGFFEYMELSPSSSDWPKKIRSNVSSPVSKGNGSIEGQDTRRHPDVQVAEVHTGFERLDTMSGIVDARYIQHCCPLLMEMRGVLVEGKKRRQRLRDPSWPDSPGLPRTVRKITPVQRPGPPQASEFSGNVALGDKVPTMSVSDLHEDQLKLQLQRTFLEQRPHLRRVVDFVVDTVAGNAARAAVLKLVPPALQVALKNVQMVLRGDDVELSVTSNSRDNTWSMVNSGQVETAVEHIITTTISQLLSPAMDYVKVHAADRTTEALAALADPEETSFVLGVAAGIAGETAGLAACRKALASISGEIRKRITDDVEVWRRKFQVLDRISTSQDGSIIGTLHSHGGTPAPASLQPRAQSWPRAAAEQQLSAEDPILDSEIGRQQDFTGLSNQLLLKPNSALVPEAEDTVTRGNRSEASPQHVIANAGVHTAVSASSSMKLVKTNTAVKRQLSFSLTKQTTFSAQTSIGWQPTSQLVKEGTDMRQDLVNGIPEKVWIRLEDRLNNKLSSQGTSFSVGERQCAVSCLDEHQKCPRESSGVGPDCLTDVLVKKETISNQGADVSTWSVGTDSRDEMLKKRNEPVLDMDMENQQLEKPSKGCAYSKASQQDLSGDLPTLGDRLIQACSNVCYYCSLKPFGDGSRHCLRQHLGVICVSLEGLLSRIQGATPAGGFDALVFHDDRVMRHSRLGEENSTLRDHTNNFVVTNMQLRVELGLVRRTVALALHLFLWDPTMMLSFCFKNEMLEPVVAERQPSPEGSLCELRTKMPDSHTASVFSVVSSFGNDQNSQSNGRKSYSFTGCHAKVEGGTMIDALLMTWKRLVECQMLPTGFVVGELLSPWRWKLAMKAQPWQGSLEKWLSVVQKGMASVVGGLMGSGAEVSPEFETLIFNFLKIMSGRGMALNGGEVISSTHHGETSATDVVSVKSGPLPEGNLLVSSSEADKQDKSLFETSSLAVGLASQVLQHYSSLQAGNVKLRDHNGEVVLASGNLEGFYFGLRKFLEASNQDFG